MPTSDLPPTSTLPSINPLIQNKTPVSGGNVPILPSINIKSKDFINAPEEYNIRARNEIKEKLFNSNDNKIDNSNIFKPKKTANSRSRNSSISYRSSNNGSAKMVSFFKPRIRVMYLII